MTKSRKLMVEYAENGSEAAFRELVARYIDLVHSTALRLVGGDAFLAQDVSQTVFADLARTARTLSPEVMIGGWLHRHTCFVAAKTMRGERRRQLRERQAVEMKALHESSTVDISQVGPILDEAINELAEPDRTAILLRFFEQYDYGKIGEMIDSSEDAARMRVNRALEKLQSVMKRRGITSTAAGLAVALSASAVQSAPVGLAVTISAAALAGTAVSTSTVIAATKAIAMTTLQKAIVTTVFVVVAGAGIFEARHAAQLHDQNQALQQQQLPSAKQIQQLQQELNDTTNQLAGALAENAKLKSRSNEDELLKLRGEVTQIKAISAEREGALHELGLAEVAARINDIKKWLEQTSSEKIPELDLLQVSDWVNITGSLRTRWQGTTNDFEFVLGHLRTIAKERFASIPGEGLDRYLVADGGQLPNGLSDLKPYLEPLEPPPLEINNDAMLQRYQLLHTGNVSGLTQSDPLISEVPPIQNAQYDALFKIGAFGYSYQAVNPLGGSGSGPVPHDQNALPKLFAGSVGP